MDKVTVLNELIKDCKIVVSKTEKGYNIWKDYNGSKEYRDSWDKNTFEEVLEHVRHFNSVQWKPKVLLKLAIMWFQEVSGLTLSHVDYEWDHHFEMNGLVWKFHINGKQFMYYKTKEVSVEQDKEISNVSHEYYEPMNIPVEWIDPIKTLSSSIMNNKNPK